MKKEKHDVIVMFRKSTHNLLKETSKKMKLGIGTTYDDAILTLLDFYNRLDNEKCRECLGKYCKERCEAKVS